MGGCKIKRSAPLGCIYEKTQPLAILRLLNVSAAPTLQGGLELYLIPSKSELFLGVLVSLSKNILA